MGPTPSHTYTVAGNYTAKLTVTTNISSTNSSSVAVEIFPPPVANPGGPYAGKVGVAVAFNGSFSTAPIGQALAYAWNFGDGATGSGEMTSHTYGSVCTCTVTLTVTDDTAGISIATTTATITASSVTANPSATPATFFAVGPAMNSTTHFAYIAMSSSAGSTTLAINTLDNTTGNLRPTGLTPPVLDSGFVASGMVTDPSSRFLYLYAGSSVLTFLIDPGSGALTPTGSTVENSASGNIGSQILKIDPTGKFAFFVMQKSGNANPTSAGLISRFSIDPNTGALGQIETVSAQVQSPTAAVLEPGGKYLYVSGIAPGTASNDSAGAPQIAMFSIDHNSGALTPVSGSPLSIESGIAATAMSADPSGRFIYAAGTSTAKNFLGLSVFSINKSTGAIAENPSPLSLDNAGAIASAIAIAPSGGFGYGLKIANLNESTAQESIQRFRLDAQTGVPASGGINAWAAAASNLATMPTGALTLFSPGQAMIDTVTQNGVHSGFLFLTVSTDTIIRVFSNDAVTGSLTFSTSANTAGH